MNAGQAAIAGSYRSERLKRAAGSCCGVLVATATLLGCVDHTTEARPGEGLWHVAGRCTQTPEAQRAAYGALVRKYGGEQARLQVGEKVQIPRVDGFEIDCGDG